MNVSTVVCPFCRTVLMDFTERLIAREPLYASLANAMVLVRLVTERRACAA